MDFYGMKDLFKAVNPVIDYDKYGNPIKAVDDYTLNNEVEQIANSITAVNDRIDCSVASLECRVHELESAHNVRANDFYPRIDNMSVQIRNFGTDIRDLTIKVQNLQTAMNMASTSIKELERQLRALTVANTENPNQKTDLEKISRIEPNPFLDRKDDKLWY